MEHVEAMDAEELFAASRTGRFLALVVDLALVAALGLAIQRFHQMHTFAFGSQTMVSAYVLTLMVTATAIYAEVHLLVVFGQTIGKWAMGIRLITPEGYVPRLGRILGCRILPVAVLLLVLEGFLHMHYAGALVLLLDALPIFLPRRRCLHDLLADTHVVRA